MEQMRLVRRPARLTWVAPGAVPLVLAVLLGGLAALIWDLPWWVAGTMSLGLWALFLLVGHLLGRLGTARTPRDGAES